MRKQTSRRLSPANRKQEILNSALLVASFPGEWGKITRASIAAHAGCAEGLINRYFGTMGAFRRAIMRAAIQSRNLAIIAQGLAAVDPNAQKAPPELKAAAVKTLAGV